MFGSCFRILAVILVSDFVFRFVSLKMGLTQTIFIRFCIVPLKLAFLFIIILCVFGHYFRTLDVNLVSDLKKIPSAYSLPLIIIVRLVFCFLLSSLILLFILSRLDFKQSICMLFLWVPFFSLQNALQTIYMLCLWHFLSPDYFANHPTCIYYAYACIPKTHNFGPMWQHQPLIIHDH